MLRKLFFAIAMLVAMNANAIIINSIDESTLADDGSGGGVHTHSSGGGIAGVGFWNSEEVRAAVEFDVSSILGSATGFFSFALTTPEGLCCGHDANHLGDFDVYAFVGDGDVDLADYFLTTTFLGTFSAAGLNVGDTITIDISMLLASFANNHLGFVFDPGVRTSTVSLNETVFNNFQIDTLAVPAPASVAMLSLGLCLMLGIGSLRRKLK